MTEDCLLPLQSRSAQAFAEARDPSQTLLQRRGIGRVGNPEIRAHAVGAAVNGSDMLLFQQSCDEIGVGFQPPPALCRLADAAGDVRKDVERALGLVAGDAGYPVEEANHQVTPLAIDVRALPEQLLRALQNRGCRGLAHGTDPARW